MIPSCLRLPASVGIVLGAMVMAGCQSTSPAASSAPPAVIAGKTTFVNVNAGQGPPVLVAYHDSSAGVCPECESVAEKYFTTGVLDEHVCKTCGATINVGQGQLITPPK
jgi:hypothetical protein